MTLWMPIEVCHIFSEDAVPTEVSATEQEVAVTMVTIFVCLKSVVLRYCFCFTVCQWIR